MIHVRLALLYFAVSPLSVLAAATDHALHVRSSLSGHETRIVVPQVTLRDSQGREQELPGLMEDRIVILNFVFTSCATICPALSAIMRSTEQQLSERLGKDVILISISVDPANDTPDKLRDYAKKIGSGTNWYWLTGNPVDIEYALRAFGVPTGGRPENHPPTILVGNTRKNQWWRWVGITTPESLVNAVNSFTNNASPSNKRSHAQQR